MEKHEKNHGDMYLLYRPPRTRTFNQAGSADRIIDDFWYLVYIIFILRRAQTRLLGTARALLLEGKWVTWLHVHLFLARRGEATLLRGGAPIVT